MSEENAQYERGIKALTEECKKLKSLLDAQKASIPQEARKENKKLKRNMQILIMELEESSVVIENKRKRIASLEQQLKEVRRGRKVCVAQPISFRLQETD